MSVELLPCPFCGEAPYFDEYTLGTCFDGPGCCFAEVSIQISDLMTMDERLGELFVGNKYGKEYVARARAEAIRQWNTRHKKGPNK